MHTHIEFDRGRSGYWRRRVAQLGGLPGMMLLLRVRHVSATVCRRSPAPSAASNLCVFRCFLYTCIAL